VKKYAFVIEPSEHAELSASSAERWTTCTASPSLIKGLPNRSSKYAAEGTAAHHVSAECLRSWFPPSKPIGTGQWLGKAALVEGHEIEMDAEFFEHVQEYLDDIANYRQPGDFEFIEQSFTEAMKRLHPKFGGSADYVNFRPSTRRLRVEDLKFGAGVPVEVDDNKQLKYYALGVLLANARFNAEEVEIRIAQPRCDHEAGRFRSYVFPAMELLDYSADLVDAARETEDFTLAKLVPSPKACKWCPAAAAEKCPAIIKDTHAIVSAQFDVVDMAAYSPAQIAEFLAKLPLVEARIKAVREFAYQQALASPGSIPGFKIVEKRATRKWVDEGAAKAALGENPLFYTTPELKSAPQIEKVLGKKKFAELAHLVDKQSSGYTLVSESDPRAPATVAQLSDFGVVDSE
jgi:hypothetical protein